MAIDLTEFKTAFPAWADCDDAVLSFWSELAECLICVPSNCPAIAKRMPFLLLAHTLQVNQVVCVGTGVVPADACTCDDDVLNQILNSGAKISSVNIDGISVTFNNVGVNSMLNQGAGAGEFGAWLSQTQYGQMLNAVLAKLNRGVHMAIGGRGLPSHYGDDNYIPLGGKHIPGHL